jgi:hypothetical protein
VPYQENSRIRPKVGEVMDEPLQIDDAVFRPMGREELEAWGL